VIGRGPDPDRGEKFRVLLDAGTSQGELRP